MHYSKFRSSVHILCTFFPEANIRTDHSHRLLVITLNSLNLHYDHVHTHACTRAHTDTCIPTTFCLLESNTKYSSFLNS